MESGILVTRELPREPCLFLDFSYTREKQTSILFQPTLLGFSVNAANPMSNTYSGD